MLILPLLVTPTYNADTSAIEFTGANGTLTLNIEDPGTGLVDEENLFTDKWLEGVYTITDSGVLGAYQDLLIAQQNTLNEINIWA